MHFCRICRTEQNLKYTIRELRKLKKQQHNNGPNNVPTPCSLGNICHDCEERLHNFQQLDEDESSIIVDDDALLYDLFFEKVEQQRQRCRREGAAKQSVPSHGVVGIGANTVEVIEVLTSRENTPSPAPPPPPPQSAAPPSAAPTASAATVQPLQEVVAVIDLEADEELAPNAALLSDKEKIVSNVEPKTNSIKCSTPAKNKNYRQRYAERELRLIASLNLVSSDESDLDEIVSPPRQPVKVATTPTVELPPEGCTKPLTATPHKCKNCEMCLPSAEHLLSHYCLQTSSARCPVCQTHFSTSQRLIHHMRCKHRSYDGDTLSERPRCAQDSAMTIRLRYLHRYTYYECQLCGRIDAVFKEHKQHVVEQHPAESKLLKDPMMQELKCPVCKERCGTQYVLLCRHILGTHSTAEYKVHLKEVTHIRSTFGWNTARQKELRRSARIFQFTKCKQYFFECKVCQKVVTGYYNHLKHLSTHAANAKQVSPSPTPASPPQPKKVKLKTLRVVVANRVERREKSSRTSSVSKKFTEPKVKGAPKQKLPKLSKKALQNALVKVKVKPPLRHFSAQQYRCKWCALVFKGFQRLNLHQLSTHSSLEYNRCESCAYSYANEAALATHARQHDDKRKRKRNDCGESALDENCNNDCSVAKRRRLATKSNNDRHTAQQPAPAQHSWLQELLLLHEQRHNDTTLPQHENDAKDCRRGAGHGQAAFIAAHQCAYCTHLFATERELQAHVAQHVQQQDMPLIRRLAAPQPPCRAPMQTRLPS